MSKLTGFYGFSLPIPDRYKVMSKDNFFDTVVGIAGFCVIALWSFGGLYWLWAAFQLGSFWMFAFGVFPLTAVFTSIIGAYGLIFSLPDWVFKFFG